MTESVAQILESGFRAQQAAQVDAAERAYLRVLDIESDNIHALNLLGMLYVNSFRPADAVVYLEKALQQASDNPQTHTNFGLALKDSGNPSKAIRHFRKSLQLDPENPDVYNNLGNVLRSVEDPTSAIKSYEQALKRRPIFAECWCNLAAALNEAGQHDRALTAVERSLELNPELAQAYNNRGDIYLALARYEDAICEYKKAVALSPKYAAALINMARTQRDMDEPSNAMETLQLALTIEPGNPEALLVQGVLYEQMGDKINAASCFEDAIQSSPDMTVAHYYLSQIKGRKGSDEEFAAMRKLDANTELTPKSRMYLEFGLFRANDQRQQYDEAFRHLANGNKIKAESVPYDDEDTARYIDALVSSAASAKKRIGIHTGGADGRPVFVLGMPRSGTSLTEQILASHSAVAGAGELSFAYDTAHAIKTMIAEQFPENMQLLSAEQYAELGEQYMNKHSSENLRSQFVVDKTPLNFQYIGLLGLALPNAKFIHCHRDPVANCFSIHRMPFDEKQAYAHSLEALGQYYSRYWHLMQDWQAMFPGRILNVRYEDTVGDIRTQSQRMLDFLGLPFEDSVLTFHKTKRLVKTPSASQVREPIYKDSIAAWKKYEGHLGLLIENLKGIGDD